MANSEKFKSLAENDAFLEKLISAKTDEEIKSVFKEHGVEISDKEIENLKKSFQQKISEELKKLPENELKEIAGGTKKQFEFDTNEFESNATEFVPAALTYGLFLGSVVGTVQGAVKGANKGYKGDKLTVNILKSAVKGALTSVSVNLAVGTAVSAIAATRKVN